MAKLKRVMLYVLVALALVFVAHIAAVSLSGYCAGVKVDLDNDGIYESCDVSHLNR